MEEQEPVKIDPDLILELNFVPKWARKPPGQQAFFDSQRGDDAAQARRSPSQGRRRNERAFPGRGGPSRQSPRDRDRTRDRDHDQGRTRDRRRQQDDRADVLQHPGGASDPRAPLHRRMPGDHRPPPFEPAPVIVGFLPKPKGLSFIVHRIHSSRCAYPLSDLASVFLSNPQYCDVKIEVRRGEERAQLYQCRECGTVATDVSLLNEHVLKHHLTEFFEPEDTEVEAPTGEFVCVARCGLSGTLLGPPNHHSYREKLLETHRTRYPNMSLEDYQGRIEMIRDPEAVAEWKENSRKRTVYRMKRDAPDDLEPMSLQAAETHMLQTVAPSLVVRGVRAVISMETARELQDDGLRETVRLAWRRENRSPRSLPFALRGAFKHMHLHMFKAHGGETFVSAIAPSPLDPTHAVENIREVLTHLNDHPGCKRDELIAALRPDCDRNSTEVAELLKPLSWLIEKGHLIEFFDGALAVPLAPHR